MEPLPSQPPSASPPPQKDKASGSAPTQSPSSAEKQLPSQTDATVTSSPPSKQITNRAIRALLNKFSLLLRDSHACRTFTTELEGHVKEAVRKLRTIHFTCFDAEGKRQLDHLLDTLHTPPIPPLLDNQQLHKQITDFLPYLAIAAQNHPDNQAVLVYFIKQGFPVTEFITDIYANHEDELVVPLPLSTQFQLLDNCQPGLPSTPFLRGMITADNPKLLSKIIPGLYRRDMPDLMLPYLRHLSVTSLYALYEQVKSRLAPTCHTALEEALSNHLCRYVKTNSEALLLAMILEAMAQKQPDWAQEALDKLDPAAITAMAKICALGGLHACAELLTHRGVQLSAGDISPDRFSLKHSPFLIARQAGLTHESEFVPTLKKLAPTLFSTANNRLENEVLQVLRSVRNKAENSDYQSWLRLLIRTVSIPRNFYNMDYQQSSDHLTALWVTIYFEAKKNNITLPDSFSRPHNQPQLVEQLQKHNALSSPASFTQFMNEYLLQVCTPPTDDISHITKETKRLRPDLWPIPEYDESEITYYYRDQLNGLRFYIKIHLNYHIQEISNLLRAVPPDYRQMVINTWLNAPDCEAQRDILFRRPFHPLTTLHEAQFWQLLLCLDQDYEFPENTLDHEWKSLKPPVRWDAAPKSIRSLLKTPTEVAGRTLRSRRKDGGWDYLKFWSTSETPADLYKEGEKIRLFTDKQKTLGLLSQIPAVAGAYRWPDLQADLNENLPKTHYNQLNLKCNYDDEGQHVPDEDFNQWQGFCLHLQTSAEAPYHLYPHDLDPVEDRKTIIQGLHRYANDFGALYRNGLLGPVIMAANHDETLQRSHHVLAPYCGAACEGKISRWLEACMNPNVGAVGMRDIGDTRTPEEMSPDYFFTLRMKTVLNLAESSDKAKLVMELLALNTQGLILQYAHCFRKSFKYKDPASVKIHEAVFRDILTTLFQQAFPNLKESDIQKTMDDHDLLRLTTREVLYWCDINAPFVKDLQTGHVPEELYPEHAGADCRKILTKTQLGEFRDNVGIVSMDDTPDLGIGNGACPLIRLNQLITRLMAQGILTTLPTPG